MSREFQNSRMKHWSGNWHLGFLVKNVKERGTIYIFSLRGKILAGKYAPNL